jgi:hypothetical protein
MGDAMNKPLLATAVCAAFGLATSAQAAVVALVISKGIPVGTGGVPVATGYTGAVLHLHSDSGNITAVDFSGTHGFQGSMIQRWTSSGGDGTYDTPSPGFSTVQNAGQTPVNFDSHFLGTQTNFPVGSALTEDAVIWPSGTQSVPFPASTDNVGYGRGTFLKGAYGIVAAVQSPDLDVAYLVVPNTGSVTYTAQVATANGTFDIAGVLPLVPEPTALSLAGVSVLGFAARRRRT